MKAPILRRNSKLYQNNYYSNVVSDSKCDEEYEENLFDKDLNKEIKETLKINTSPKVVEAIKKLKASYNYDVNRIVENAA